MFLTVFKEDKNQIKYLENFKIKTIVLSNEKDFGLDNYSNKMEIFLKSLNLKIEEELDIESMTDENVIDFVYKKLEPFDAQDSILLQQIQTALTNCRFLYDDKNKVILEFYEELSSYDINGNLRKIYKKFREIDIENLSTPNEEKIHKIYDILRKANIEGIITTSDNSSEKKYLPFRKFNSTNKSLEKLCNFNFDGIEVNENNVKQLMMKAFFYYQKYEYEKAYNIIQKVISICFKQKNYIQLFFAMFNYNALLKNIQFNRISYDISEKYKNTKPYNLDEKFYELPKAIQKVLKDIKPFLSYEYLYKFIFQVDDELIKKRIQKKNIEEENGFILDSNVTRNYCKQKNLIYFVLNNYIMLERSLEFCSIQEKLLQISLIRQIQNENLTLDKMELYSAIKYIKNKDLKNIFGDFKDKNLKIECSDINWLVKKVFKNLIILYAGNIKPLFGLFVYELENIILILSKQELNIFQSNKILENIYKLIENGKPSLDLYKLINDLIYHQKNMKNKDLIKIIELMINKILIGKYNASDYKTLLNNTFYAPFVHIEKSAEKFDNLDLIKKFLNLLKTKPFLIEDQIKISQGFLINIYFISNEKIKGLIKDFILDIDVANIENYGLKISFKLFLVIQEFTKIDKDLIEEIKIYPHEMGNNVYFVGEITGQIRYLVEEKNIEELKPLLQELLNLINKINEKIKIESVNSII